MTKANPIYENVDKAPFHIGVRVKVVRLTDDTSNPDYLDKEGVLVYYEYECECGQTYPNDPLIGVHFEDGHVEEYWREELRRVE